MLSGLTPLDGPSQTLPKIYALPATAFHDITSGTSTGAPNYSAGPGYDLVTGLGTPDAPLIVGGLIGINVQLTAPATATAGSPFGVTVRAVDSLGNTFTSYLGTVHFTTSDTGRRGLAGELHLRRCRPWCACLQHRCDSGYGRQVKPHGNRHHFRQRQQRHGDREPGRRQSLRGHCSVLGTAGIAFNLTVSTFDQFGNLVPNYTGVVHFTTSDPSASVVLPGNYAFTSADNGVHVFSAGGTLATAGSQNVTATDVASGITGSGVINVVASYTSHLALVAPASTVAGNKLNLTVKALDQFGNIAKSYTGSVYFTTSDPSTSAAMPSTYLFTAADSGIHVFTNPLLITAGLQTISATDLSNNSITGNVAVSVQSGAVSRLAIVSSINANAGVAFGITVEPLDSFGNSAASYTGVVQFSTSDKGAGVVLPANYRFVVSDNGMHVFSGLTLVTAGTQSVVVTDTANTNLLGSAAFNVFPAAATHFFVSGPATATAGIGSSVTVTARDSYNNTVPGYLGTVHFATTDSGAGATLPGNYTFVASDGGVHVFTAGVILTTAASQTVTVTDTVTTSMAGSAVVSVKPATASRFTLSAPASVVSGSLFNVTVEAFDFFGNLATGYSGTVQFTTTDANSNVATPANYTFAPADSGSHTFTASAELVTLGTQTLTAFDVANNSIAGSTTLAVAPAPATHFSISAPATANAGTAFGVTVTALDQFNRIVAGYTGTVHLATSDTGIAAALVQANYTFASADHGVHTFNGDVTLVTAGSQTVSAVDTVSSGIAGNTNVVVNPAAASRFLLAAPAVAVQGTLFSLTVTAQDTYGNTATGYTGAVHFTTNDTGAAPSFRTTTPSAPPTTACTYSPATQL